MNKTPLKLITADSTEFFNITEKDKLGMRSETWIAYRYLTKSKALDLLRTGEIYMANHAQWEDPFEGELYMYWGLISGEGHLSKYMKSICLTEDPESDLIWKAYCPDNSGIKLGFKVNAFAAELDGNVLGRILYINKISTLDIINNALEQIPSMHSHKLLFIKQRAYEGERELRILKLDDEHTPEQPCRIKINIANCIDSVTINPRASEEDKLELQNAIKNAGLNTYITPSAYLSRDWDYMLAAAGKHIKKNAKKGTINEDD